MRFTTTNGENGIRRAFTIHRGMILVYENVHATVKCAPFETEKRKKQYVYTNHLPIAKLLSVYRIPLILADLCPVVYARLKYPAAPNLVFVLIKYPMALLRVAIPFCRVLNEAIYLWP